MNKKAILLVSVMACALFSSLGTGDVFARGAKTVGVTEASLSKDRKAGQGPVVEVGLLSGVVKAEITGSVPFYVEVKGKKVMSFKKGESIVVTRKGNDILIEGKKMGDRAYLKSAEKDGTFLVKGSRYRGAMKLIPSSWNDGFTVVNAVSMEEYLQGVVPCEVIPSWQQEALKAQAVAARTYALFHKDGYRSAGYDVTDDTRSQVYRGYSAETDSTNRAIHETAGEVLTYGGKVIDAVFHANGGGYTENAENVWGTAFPYLQGVKEESGSEVNRKWEKSMTLSEFTRQLNNYGYNIGKLKAIKLSALHIGKKHSTSDRGVSGRVQSLEVKGTKGTKQITGEGMQSIFDLDSTLFDLHVKGKQITIVGYGWGHGLGLSQWGAEAMATNHKSEKNYYKKILAHYFKGTRLEKIY